MRRADNGSTLTIFVIPIIVILLGLSIIGGVSGVKSKQKNYISDGWQAVECTVVSKGADINKQYDYGVALDDVKIDNNMYHITYNNERGKRVDSLYGCKVQRLNTMTEQEFLVNPNDEHDLWLVVGDKVITIGNTIGVIFIIAGFLICANGLSGIRVKDKE